MLPSFDSWSLSMPLIPSRSQLYSLEPVGVGTPLVESLTGYVARLAEAHSVSVGDLAGRVLSRLASPKGPIITVAKRAGRIDGHGFHACGYAMNGVTDRATRWVHALESATTRRNLQFLTLFPLRHVLPEHLFRHRRAWCAACFDQWRVNGRITYEPLLWAIKVSLHCPVHARSLDCICRNCGKTLSPLGVFSRPGHCDHCGGWLGAPDTHSYQACLGSPDIGDEMRSSTHVGDLLAMLPQIDPLVVRESLCRNLVTYLKQVAGGNVLALAQHIRCPHSILQNWLQGATVPRLESLLRTSRFLNVPASTLFSPSGPTSMNIAAARAAMALTGNRGVSPSRHADEIRQALLAELSETVPRSLSEVARGLGYTNTERLYQADRKLCHEIAAKYRQSGRSHWWKKPGAPRICETDRLKEILERSLKLTEPISVHRIAIELGYSNDGYIQKKFPQLCQAVGKKIARVKRARPYAIQQALRDALHEDPAPTLTELSLRLGYSSSTVLRAHEPDLCDQLRARRAAHILRCRADLESKATAALSENPAPSVQDVCKRLGLTLFVMSKHFPALRRAIAERHRQWTSSTTAQRRENLFLDIASIASELHIRGTYPSVKDIVACLPPGSCREWTSITLAIRQAHQALGISR
jgi:AraC-like DNA-binding protein